MTLLVENRSLREAFKRGERFALEAVYREYVRPVYGFLSRGFSFESQGTSRTFIGLRAAWETEDAVQTVFLRAFSEKARLAYDGLRPYRNYLFSIARNFVLDELKSRREVLFIDDSQSEGDQIQDPNDSMEQTPEDVAADQELERDVASFVDSLPEKAREVFVLRFRQSLSVLESASRLKTSEHFIKSTEKQIKKRFFVFMQQRGHFAHWRYDSLKTQSLILMLLLGVGGAT